MAPAKNALGAIAVRRGDLESAERLPAKRSPSARRPPGPLQPGADRGGARRPSTAEREYLEELELHPDTFKAAFNLSRLYAQIGEKQLEIDALRQALDGNPKFADGHFFLARALLASGGSLDEAARLARKGLELAPTSERAPLGHYVLADIYNRRGRPGDAAREVAMARALEDEARSDALTPRPPPEC